MRFRNSRTWWWIALAAIVGVTSGNAALSAVRNEALGIGDPDPNSWQHVQNVKRATGAGRWYPADADQLRDAVDGYLSANTSVTPNKPIALIVPHAGYVYSGPVAGAMYAMLQGHDYERVLLLGLSHGTPLRGASVLEVDAYETPLGLTRTDTEARDALLDCPVVTVQPQAHLGEHSAENQLPMLQRALGDFGLVEVLVGEMTDEERGLLAGVVRGLMNEKTLLVVSTDFTHFGPSFGYAPFQVNVPDRLRMLNDAAVREILEVDVPGWRSFLSNTQATICGRNPVSLLLETLMPYDDIEGRRLAYATSGEITGDFTTSVTYAGIAFWRIGAGLDQTEQRLLVRLARNIVSDYLNSLETPTLDVNDYDFTPRIESLGAAFVTLRNEGELRGCIGHILPMTPLFQSVAENAYQACLDPRFRDNPVTSSEVSDLEIEVSVLTPIRRLLDPQDVRVGTDGLLIVRGRNRGVLLPQIPIEEGWNREQFLSGACLKAGLPANAWQASLTEIYRFSAQVFGEGELGTQLTPERSDER